MQEEELTLGTYITRAGLTACEVSIRNITSLEIHPPLFVKPLKFIAHGHIFERLWYRTSDTEVFKLLVKL